MDPSTSYSTITITPGAHRGKMRMGFPLLMPILFILVPMAIMSVHTVPSPIRNINGDVNGNRRRFSSTPLVGSGPYAGASYPGASSAPFSGATLTTSSVDRIVQDNVDDVKKVFQSKMIKFDEFFKELLKTSKRDFHTMFIQTYGLLYERNSYIFTEMFQDLERYYNHGGVDLYVVFDNFFHRLYQKMFQVLNAQFTFDQPYLTCVSDKMEELKPFGDIPKKLRIEVKRSFVATRIFVQSMAGASDTLDMVKEVHPSIDCSNAIGLFSSCTACKAGTSKLCPSVCTTVMHRCLLPYTHLNEEWNKFVQQFLLLLDRLDSSFNIESVVEPINIKISEAIMNFQEKGIVVSNKLFDTCGKPRMGRNRDKRSPSSLVERDSVPLDKLKFNTRVTQPSGSSPSVPSLSKILSEIRKKIKKNKDLFIGFTNNICSQSRFTSISSSSPSSSSSSGSVSSSSSSSFSSSIIMDEHRCWNGTQLIMNDESRSHSMMSSAYTSTRTRRVDSSRRTPEQIGLLRSVNQRLKRMTSQMHSAYSGVDVEWNGNNYVDPFADLGSIDNGSGSGNGDDDEPGDIVEENGAKNGIDESRKRQNKEDGIFFQSSTSPPISSGGSGLVTVSSVVIYNTGTSTSFNQVTITLLCIFSSMSASLVLLLVS